MFPLSSISHALIDHGGYLRRTLEKEYASGVIMFFVTSWHKLEKVKC